MTGVRIPSFITPLSLVGGVFLFVNVPHAVWRATVAHERERMGHSSAYWLATAGANAVAGGAFARVGIRRGRAAREAERRSKGLCVRCGYDLRGTPDRCPECGTAPAAA